MAATEKTLEDLFHESLKDIYSAEKQILRSLTKMAKAADGEKLAMGFQKHALETKGQIERLEQVFELLGKPARGKTCRAIQGILEEATEMMAEFKGSEALDAAIIAAAQAVEHYEMTRYGTLVTWAQQLGHNDVVSLLQKTLDEEKATDQRLTKLAESRINRRAAS